MKVSFKQSSTLTTKFSHSFFNRVSGGFTALAKKLEKSRKELIALQTETATTWAQLVKGKIIDQIYGNEWIKKPQSLDEVYARRKARANPPLDSAIHRAKNQALSKQIVIHETGGTATVGYAGYASSPFNQTMTNKQIRARRLTQRELRQANFKRTVKGAVVKSAMPLANLAAMLEFGNKKTNIPARPFFGPAIQWATRELLKGLPNDMYNAIMGPEGRRKSGHRTLFKLVNDA